MEKKNYSWQFASTVVCRVIFSLPQITAAEQLKPDENLACFRITECSGERKFPFRASGKYALSQFGFYKREEKTVLNFRNPSSVVDVLLKQHFSPLEITQLEKKEV